MPFFNIEDYYRAYFPNGTNPRAFVVRAGTGSGTQNLVVTAAPQDSTDDEMKTKLANNFLVGCDPEFVVLDKTGDRVYNVINAGVPHVGEIGWDHNGLVVEVRPKPAMGTYALVKRIRQAFRQNPALANVSELKWRAGAAFRTRTTGDAADPLTGQVGPSRLLTLGGHVHFDIAPPQGGGEEEHLQRMKALDRVTKYLEKLDILPRAESILRRQHGARSRAADAQYGKWGDWRSAEGGTHGYHIEYRTMASWLYSPVASFLAMTGAKLAAVSPQLAIDTLKESNVSFANLVSFFGLYRHKDENAQRALDKLLDGQDIKALQCDPDSDFKKNWKEISF